MSIHYGATFDLRAVDPYIVNVEEAYQFVESLDTPGMKILAYCEEKVPFAGNDAPESFCPTRPMPGPELRFNYSFPLTPEQHATHGYLYEEFVLSSKPIWILLSTGQGTSRWRFLNYFDNLQDSFHTPNNARMTTLHLPRHTFVSLDQAQEEPSPNIDIYHFPRQFLFESLQSRSTVITRVNPKIPGFLRWGVQRLLALGIANVFWQWILLALAPLTPVAVVGWIWRRVTR